MARVKQTPSKKSAAGAAALGAKKNLVLKKIKDAAAAAAAAAGGGGGRKKAKADVIQTGKLKMPFKPALSKQLVSAKNGLLKQLKRRWR
jgi:hypothetical protein